MTLFRWEDTPSLRHHCGFCSRPLSHPGSKQSCLGVHAEPCSRFHQALFMRGHSHDCMACNGMDEAHYKRHIEIAETLRGLYDSCGLPSSIVPPSHADYETTRNGSEGLDGKGHNTRPPEGNENRNVGSRGGKKKKDRKLAKRLAKAASRPKVITSDEIKYIRDILHPDGDDGGAFDPKNPEEIEEIERQLRYHAGVFTTGMKWSELESFRATPEYSIHFDTEMERILEAFRVTEIVKSDIKSGALQGREKKQLSDRVEACKSMIVEDLVYVKKDQMETRMRRNAYLRYANRTSVDILNDRHEEVNWKTGEKVVYNVNSSIVQDEEQGDNKENTPPIKSTSRNKSSKDDAVVKQGSMRGPDTKSPDLRHLLYDNGSVKCLSPSQVQRTMSTRSPSSTPSTTASPIPTTFKVLNIIQPKPMIPCTPDSPGWSTIVKGDKAKTALKLPTATSAGFKETHRKPSPVQNVLARRSTSHIPSIVKESARPNFFENAGKKSATFASDMNESHSNFVSKASIDPKKKTTHPFKSSTNSAQNPSPKEAEDLDSSQPPISQKRVKKAKRNAEWKARKHAKLALEAKKSEKVNELDDILDTILKFKVPPAKCGDKTKDASSGTIQEANILTTSQSGNHACELPSEENVTMTEATLEIGTAINSENTMQLVSNSPQVRTNPQINGANNPPHDSNANLNVFPVSIPNSSRQVQFASTAPLINSRSLGRIHRDWLNFDTNLIVDSEPSPFLLCSSPCLFYLLKIKDCPFHPPDCRYTPLQNNEVFIVLPASQSFYTGPYNRLHGERLLQFFHNQPQTRSRMMLIDETMRQWLTLSAHACQWDPSLEFKQPFSLANEKTKYLCGYTPGRLMKQEQRYDALAAVNNSAPHLPSPIVLASMLRSAEPIDCGKCCYCNGAVDEDPSKMIDCSFSRCSIGRFHKDCVAEWFPDELTRWYCTECQEEMEKIAVKLLESLPGGRPPRPRPQKVVEHLK